jgi:type II secretory pathway pseudopilin PulG
MRRRAQQGMTLMETLAAALVISITAGGTLMAFVAAARMMRGNENPGVIEAAAYAQELIEGFRNRLAVDGDDGFLAAQPPGVWVKAHLPADAYPLPAAGVSGPNSILNGDVMRCYRVTPEDCDGVGGSGDCRRVDVQMCWNDITGCCSP